jgi:cystathionine beta-lyase
VRASTVLFEDAATMRGRKSVPYTYGLNNTPTIEALNDCITELEEAEGTVLVPSGLAACTLPLIAFLKPGDQVLIPDNVYWPTRRFANHTLKRLGIEITYYDPLIGEQIEDHFMDTGKVVFLEAPGSNTFEMPDLPALIKAAQKHDAITMIDNTWATPLIYKPIPNGIDISIQAGTKYYAGHSDVVLGAISANEKHWQHLKNTHQNFGLQAGTEEIYLTLRGIRTMGVRLERHEQSALKIAQWLQSRPEVSPRSAPCLAE